MPRPNYRDKIIVTARELFDQRGIHATGIDLIIAQTGIARMTLYNHCASKEALVSAVLDRDITGARAYLGNLVCQPGKSPEERLELIFGALERAMQGPQFFGCLFIKAAAEYSDEDHMIHKAALEYKAIYRDALRQLVNEMNIVADETLTAQLFLLFEGALVTAQVDSKYRNVHDALEAARILVQFHKRA